MKRRQFLALSMAAASGLVAGCNGGVGPITDKWLADGQYEETLKAFLITQDGKKLVVLGQRYHYIFDLPPALYKVMTSSYRPKRRAPASARRPSRFRGAGRQDLGPL